MTGLIGAFQSTDNTYLQYVDGSIMTDGLFSDAFGQNFGQVYGGGFNTDCFMIDTAGSVQRCSNANILCEKKLVRDSKLCLTKTSLATSLNLNASTAITISQHYKSSMCIEYCRGTEFNQVKFSFVVFFSLTFLQHPKTTH